MSNCFLKQICFGSNQEEIRKRKCKVLRWNWNLPHCEAGNFIPVFIASYTVQHGPQYLTCSQKFKEAINSKDNGLRQKFIKAIFKRSNFKQGNILKTFEIKSARWIWRFTKWLRERQIKQRALNIYLYNDLFP